MWDGEGCGVVGRISAGGESGVDIGRDFAGV